MKLGDIEKLSEINLVDPGGFTGGVPHHWLAFLRREAPVFWHNESKGRGFWVLSRYDDIRYVSSHPERFISGRGTNIFELVGDDLAEVQTQLINMDPPRHGKYRRLVQRGFTPRMVARMAGQIRDTATEIIDRVAGEPEFDFVADVAAQLPTRVICELLGVPDSDRQYLYDLSNRLIGFDDPEFQTSFADGREAATEMYVYAQGLADTRRVDPGDDLVSVLLSADIDGTALNDHEFNSFFLLLAIAGNETTRSSTANGLRLLIENRDSYLELRSDPALVPTAVEEILRYEPPVIHFRRTATQDSELGGAQIRKGDKVTLWYPSANRETAHFADPDTFDIRRQPNEHLSFGYGEHYCLGANLARMQLNTMFELIVTRLPELQLRAKPERLRSNFINGIKRMPVGPVS
jgi:cholest-4-en-3-one 26-monooxygenase